MLRLPNQGSTVHEGQTHITKRLVFPRKRRIALPRQPPSVVLYPHALIPRKKPELHFAAMICLLIDKVKSASPQIRILHL